LVNVSSKNEILIFFSLARNHFENSEIQRTWKMLGGLRHTLLALKSQLLLIKDVVGVLLLCGGGG
jgi:hypothetical protein